jgi:hypothetical protein
MTFKSKKWKKKLVQKKNLTRKIDSVKRLSSRLLKSTKNASIVKNFKKKDVWKMSLRLKWPRNLLRTSA